MKEGRCYNMARKQYAKVLWYGEYRVIHDDSRKYNKWLVTKQNKKVADFADFASCLLYMVDVVMEGR